MRFKRIGALALVAGLAFPAAALADTYKVDKSHTTAGFTVRHLFSKVKGRFDGFEGTIVFDPGQPEKTKVEGTIDVASINTNQEKRDVHLRSKDFFHAEKFPKISFVSTGVSDLSADKKSGKMQGKLTIRGVEKPVVLDVSYLGAGKDPWGNQRAGFSASTTINRKDFGLNWNETLETGGLLVGEEVNIELEVEGLVE